MSQLLEKEFCCIISKVILKYDGKILSKIFMQWYLCLFFYFLSQRGNKRIYLGLQSLFKWLGFAYYEVLLPDFVKIVQFVFIDVHANAMCFSVEKTDLSFLLYNSMCSIIVHTEQ